MAIEIVSFPMKHCDFPWLCNSLPEGKSSNYTAAPCFKTRRLAQRFIQPSPARWQLFQPDSRCLCQRCWWYHIAMLLVVPVQSSTWVVKNPEMSLIWVRSLVLLRLHPHCSISSWKIHTMGETGLGRECLVGFSGISTMFHKKDRTRTQQNLIRTLSELYIRGVETPHPKRWNLVVNSGHHPWKACFV